MLELLARLLLWATAGYLLALGALLLISPEHGRRFLGGFAQTARAHALELGLRIMVGAAFVLHAPDMAGTMLCRLAGWVLIGTSLVLALMPWRWHARIARRTVPMATRFSGLLGLAALAMGAAIAFALLAGRAA